MILLFLLLLCLYLIILYSEKGPTQKSPTLQLKMIVIPFCLTSQEQINIAKRCVVCGGIWGCGNKWDWWKRPDMCTCFSFFLVRISLAQKISTEYCSSLVTLYGRYQQLVIVWCLEFSLFWKKPIYEAVEFFVGVFKPP